MPEYENLFWDVCCFSVNVLFKLFVVLNYSILPQFRSQFMFQFVTAFNWCINRFIYFSAVLWFFQQSIYNICCVVVVYLLDAMFLIMFSSCWKFSGFNGAVVCCQFMWRWMIGCCVYGLVHNSGFSNYITMIAVLLDSKV